MNKVCPAKPEDAAAIIEICNQGIRARVATFQTQERTLADIQTWFENPKYSLDGIWRDVVIVEKLLEPEPSTQTLSLP